MNALQRRIGAYMKAEKLSLRKMAARAGMSPSYLSMIMNGRRTAMSYWMLHRIAKAVNFPPDKVRRLVWSYGEKGRSE